MQLFQNFRDVGSVPLSKIGFAATMRAAKVIGDRRDVNPTLLPTPAGTIELVRADIDERGGVAVVRVFENDEVFAAGVRAREAESELIGFAAGIQEITDF